MLNDTYRWLNSELERRVSCFDFRRRSNGYTIRGSIVGTRLDLEESLAFAGDGKVKATIETLPLESINDVFSRLKKGQVNGRVVLGLKEETLAKAATGGLAS